MEGTVATDADDAPGKEEPVNRAEAPLTEAAEPLAEPAEPLAEPAEPLAEPAEPPAEVAEPLADAAEPLAEAASPTESEAPPPAEAPAAAVPDVAPAAQPAVRLTETWGDNPRMRHIPSLEWLIDKLDRDLRERIGIVLAPITELTPPQRATLDDPLKALCTSLERLGEVARHGRGSHPPNDLLAHVTWSLNNAVSAVRTLDGDLFGRRYPVQTHERSKSEPIYAALLSVIAHLSALTDRVREIDPLVDEKLYAPLAKLEEPMRAEPMA